MNLGSSLAVPRTTTEWSRSTHGDAKTAIFLLIAHNGSTLVRMTALADEMYLRGTFLRQMCA